MKDYTHSQSRIATFGGPIFSKLEAQEVRAASSELQQSYHNLYGPRPKTIHVVARVTNDYYHASPLFQFWGHPHNIVVMGCREHGFEGWSFTWEIKLDRIFVGEERGWKFLPRHPIKTFDPSRAQ